MICVSIKENNYIDIRSKMQGEKFVEIRLDDVVLDYNQMEKIFSEEDIKTIATCRTGKYNNTQREKILLQAISLGSNYVDVEIESDENYKKEIINYALKHNCKIIISYHNFEGTPSSIDLKNIIASCFKDNANIAKIACKNNSKKDLARILSLYDFYNKDNSKQILALGMGEIGKLSRVVAPFLGAPFTFVSKGKETAEGQLSKNEFLTIFESIKNL